MRHIPLFILLVFATGFGASFLSPVDEWYFGLNQPSFTPPPWLFGPVWTALYVMIGIAGALTWKRAPGSAAIKLWFAQLVLNGAWSIVFFRLHMIDLAVAVILALLAAILLFIRASWTSQRRAAWLFIPYAMWVGFATLLNIAFAVMN